VCVCTCIYVCVCVQGHSATIFRNFFVIFGGMGPEGLLNDVSALNLDSMEWVPPSTSGLPPIRRHQHSSCTFARNLVIFGGFSEYGDVENDISVLDMDSWKWTVPKLTGEPPCPRMSHTATRFGKDMLCYGGYCLPETAGEKRYLSDVFVLKTDTWTWSAPDMGSAVPSSLERAGHTADAVNDLLLILGLSVCCSSLDASWHACHSRIMQNPTNTQTHKHTKHTYTHTRTHMQIHTNTDTHTHTNIDTQTLSPSLFLSHKYAHTQTQTHTLSHTYAHTRTHTYIHTLTHTHTHTISLSFSPPPNIHTHIHTRTHTHTPPPTPTRTEARACARTHTFMHTQTRTHTRIACV